MELDSECQPGGQTACGEAAFYCTQHRWGASGRLELSSGIGRRLHRVN